MAQNRLGLAALVERQVAARKQVHRHVERLLGVVVTLERVSGVDVLEGLEQVDDRLLLLLDRRRVRNALVPKSGHTQDIKDKDAVVGDDRPAALGHDRGRLDGRILAHGLDVIDDIVGVLLERVVDARLEVRLRSVIVTPRPPPTSSTRAPLLP